MGRNVLYSGREAVKSKTWSAILYPDSESYNFDMVLQNIKLMAYKFAYILHDQDYYTSEDCDSDTDLGKKKKDHFHVVFFWDNSYQLGYIANKIGLPSNYMQKTESRSGAIQYLTHKNNPEKHQYNISDIVTNIEKIQSKFFADDDCIMKASKLLDFITSYSGHLTVTQVASWAITENCWDEFRRGQHLFTALISEHNYFIKGVVENGI